MFGYLSELMSKSKMVDQNSALKGRDDYAYAISTTHEALKNPIRGEFPKHLQNVYFAMGCFWGAERRFWQQEGVWTTAVGYQGGFTTYPTYKEVCTTKTGHTESVLVVYDPQKTTLQKLLKVFWESHDPTQGMRQGNDVGTQYRSAIYTTSDEQLQDILESQKSFAEGLEKAGLGVITTEIGMAKTFYYAEDYHQQYLHKNPNGYCGLRGTGVECKL
jgi:peptide-methionine (S)-S-oxide reductase